MKHLDIFETLKREIAAGKFADRLFPSELMLQRRFGTARGTVRQALSELEESGLVCRKKGSRTSVVQRANPATGRLGLLMPDMSMSMIFGLLASEFGRLAQENGYVFLVGDGTRRKPSALAAAARKFVRELVRQRVEGVVFRPFVDESLAVENRRIVDALSKEGIPVVLIDADIVQSPDRSRFDLVGINHVDAGRRAAEHLISSGRKRICYQLDRPSVVSRNRFFGVMGAVLGAGGKWSDAQVIRFAPEDAAAYAKLFKCRRTSPDAIICEDDEVAVRVIKTLIALGKRIPKDVAFVGCDHVPAAFAQIPELTTIHQPVDLLAETAFKMLMTRIRQPDIAPRETLLDAPLVVRGST